MNAALTEVAGLYSRIRPEDRSGAAFWMSQRTLKDLANFQEWANSGPGDAFIMQFGRYTIFGIPVQFDDHMETGVVSLVVNIGSVQTRK